MVVHNFFLERVLVSQMLPVLPIKTKLKNSTFSKLSMKMFCDFIVVNTTKGSERKLSAFKKIFRTFQILIFCHDADKMTTLK